MSVPEPLALPELPDLSVSHSRFRTAGAYVHFPWCLAKCPYCDFVSWVEPGADHRGYADAVIREIEARGELVHRREIASVFFGGGTPSLWEPRELGRVLEAVRGKASACSAEIEVTV